MADNNIIVIDNDKKDDSDVREELVSKIASMESDRDIKIGNAMEQLVESLKVTADKYRTATGVMEALRVMRMVNDGCPSDMRIYDEIEGARDLASLMVEEVGKLVEKAKGLKASDMESLCDGAYEVDFVSKGFSAMDLCFELMRLDLCRNVGPAAEDITGFWKRSMEEIVDTKEELDRMERS